MNIKHFLSILLLALLFTACQAPKLGYFQDIQAGQVMPLTKSQYVKIQPGDRLSILISSKDPGLAYLYNLNIVGHYIASSSNNLSTSQIAIYTVDPNGDIDFPVVGKLHIADMTRHEIANFVKDKLISGSYLKTPQ